MSARPLKDDRPATQALPAPAGRRRAPALAVALVIAGLALGAAAGLIAKGGGQDRGSLSSTAPTFVVSSGSSLPVVPAAGVLAALPGLHKRSHVASAGAGSSPAASSTQSSVTSAAPSTAAATPSSESKAAAPTPSKPAVKHEESGGGLRQESGGGA